MDNPLTRFRLSGLLAGLSHALDLTEGQPRGHCIRSAWIGMQIGLYRRMWPDEISDLTYTILLKDLGCSSNAARICELYLADDRAIKRDYKLIDGSLPQALRFVLGHTGLAAGLAGRFRAIIGILQNGGEIARELIEARCHRGADIAKRLRFPPPVCDGIRSLDEHWDGSGRPEGLSGSAIPLLSQIALLAQVCDVFHRENGPEAARREVRQRASTWFDPALVADFEAVAADPLFWEMLADENLAGHMAALEPAESMRLADADYLDDIAQAFAGVIDSKSPFTNGHSTRVAVFTDLIAEEMGFAPERRRWLARAALLHDIGKLGISNSILDKPGRLTEAEFAEVKRHPVYSEEILEGTGVFAGIAGIGGGHHERLDGKGYPRGLTAADIPLETRIVTVADIFDALTADRPYRKAMPVSQALAILEAEAGTAIDPQCLQALRASLHRAERAAA